MIRFGIFGKMCRKSCPNYEKTLNNAKFYACGTKKGQKMR